MPWRCAAISAEATASTIDTTRGQRHRGAAGELGLEVAALEVLHHEVGLVLVGDVEVDDLHDVWVPQLRHELGLAAEPRMCLGVGEQATQQHLDREPTRQAGVHRFVDDAGATEADLPDQSVGIVQDDGLCLAPATSADSCGSSGSRRGCFHCFGPRVAGRQQR